MTQNTFQTKSENQRTFLSKHQIILGFISFFSSLILVVSLTSYLLTWEVNQSQTGELLNPEITSTNFFGKFGNTLGHFFIFKTFGIAAYIIAFLFFLLALTFWKKKLFKPWKSLSHSLFYIIWLPITLGAILKGENVWSGVYGYQIQDFLRVLLGTFGLWMLILISIASYFIFEYKLSLSNIEEKKNIFLNWLQSILPKKVNETDETYEPENTFFKEEISPAKPFINEETPKLSQPKKDLLEGDLDLKQNQRVEQTDSLSNLLNLTPPQSQTGLEELALPDLEEKTEILFTATSPNPELKPNSLDFQTTANTPIASDIRIKIESPEQSPTDLHNDENLMAEKLVSQYGEYDHKLDLPHFQMPTLDLLKDYGNSQITINQSELEENKNRIVGLLKTFNVGISEIKATIGPSVTLYEIVPQAGIRVAQIKKLQDDIALNLSAMGIRIIAPMPGKGTIGIEVPNQNPTMVSMHSVIQSPKFQKSDMELPIVFGKNISNEIVIADLAKMPHLLMAGATGQGKSVGINVILTSLLYKKHPSELKFVMVDPKKVELSLYSKIERHYLAKLPDGGDAIITDNAKVINTLNSLCIEMDQRYDLLKLAFCKNLKEYNHKFTKRQLNPENGHRYLPYIVLVVDEFADLIMTAGKEVEIPIARLAQLARAIGIHLIIATQRPSVNIITGMIKANFPTRVSFKVMQSIDSRTILDSTGAEQLIGKGDMLLNNGMDLIRVQCAFIDTPEVEHLAEFIGSQRGYASAYQLPEYNNEEGILSITGIDPNDRDSLFEEAARIFVNTQQASTSMLQRQLKLGFNRAGRIVDQLEATGIVSGFNGSKQRDVLFSDIQSLERFLEELKNK